MPTVGTTSKPAYVYDAGTDTWVPVGVGAHTHDTSALVSVNSYSVAGKNTVINGGFDIWQRGTSIAIAGNGSGTYTADRWYNARNSTGQTVSRQVTGDTTNLPNIQYCARVQRDSGNTDTSTPVRLSTAFETVNSIPLAGKTVTFSLYARKGANFSAASDLMVAQLITGTGTDQNALTGGYTSIAYPLGNIMATLTTTWQRFTISGAIPTNATEITLNTYYIPTGTAGANDYYEITGVQLEVGSVATQFSRAGGTIQGELAACQRYFSKSYDQSVAPGTASSNGNLVLIAHANISYGSFGPVIFPVTMRTSPVVTLYNPSTGSSTANVAIRNTSANTNLPSIVQYTGESGFSPWLNNSAITTGTVCTVAWTASAEL